MRAFIRSLDGLLRRLNGVFEFCGEPYCILRLQISKARHDVALAQGTWLCAGEPVLLLHLWNERLSGSGVSDLAWALAIGRRWVQSLCALGRWLAECSGLHEIRAIGAVTILVSSAPQSGSFQFARRMGFEAFPYRGPWGRVGTFWENLYTWGLMWAYNPASLRSRRLATLERTEIWMPMGEFLRRFGPQASDRPGEDQ